MLTAAGLAGAMVLLVLAARAVTVVALTLLANTWRPKYSRLTGGEAGVIWWAGSMRGASELERGPGREQAAGGRGAALQAGPPLLPRQTQPKSCSPACPCSPARPPAQSRWRWGTSSLGSRAAGSPPTTRSSAWPSTWPCASSQVGGQLGWGGSLLLWTSGSSSAAGEPDQRPPLHAARARRAVMLGGVTGGLVRCLLGPDDGTLAPCSTMQSLPSMDGVRCGLPARKAVGLRCADCGVLGLERVRSTRP